MRDVRFTHIHAENFGNQKLLDADLFDKTVIRGYNKEGKSTIYGAIIWLLTDKTPDNSAAGDSYRPHDAEGNRIDYVETKVSVTVKCGENSYILTKIQKQKWIKKRGSDVSEFQGNENLYEISGVPKKAKDFEQFISDNICPVDELPFCINAKAFLSMDNKKRRAKVLGLAKTFTNADIIATDERFKELEQDLSVGTVEELSKRQKQAISTLKKTLEELPARIDEANKQIVDYDFSALELEKNALNEELSGIEKAEEAETELKNKIMSAKYELNSIEQKLSSKVKEEQSDIRVKMAELQREQQKVHDDYIRLIDEEEKADCTIHNNKKAIEEAEKQKEIASTRFFDDSSLVCPTCGQNYPAEKEKEIRDTFEKNRLNEMNRLVDYIDSLKNGLETATAKKKEVLDRIVEVEKTLNEYKGKIQDLNNKSLSLSLDFDATKDASYKAKFDEITALQTQAGNTSFDAQKAEIKAKIHDVERKLAQAETNARVEERIAQLSEERKTVAQEILKQEKLLSLIEEFNRAKIAMLEDSVNEYFSIIKFRFFEKQINGGYQEVCKAIVSGTDYDGLLNKSDRLLCQADIVNGFQKANDVSLPVLIDDCESIDANRIPRFDKQMLMFRRDDCRLEIRSE